MPKYTDDLANKNNLLISSNAEPCILCQEPTYYIDPAFKVGFCSTECEDECKRIVCKRIVDAFNNLNYK